MHKLIQYVYFLDQRQSNLQVKSCKELKDLLIQGTVHRHSRKTADVGKLKARYYDVVDIVYDKQDRYVPKCYICQKCSQLIVVVKEGGHSVLKTHKCVSAYLAEIKKEEAREARREAGLEDEVVEEKQVDDDFFYNQFMVTNSQRETLARAISKISKVSHKHGQFSRDEVRDLLPSTWLIEPWTNFLRNAKGNVTPNEMEVESSSNQTETNVNDANGEQDKNKKDGTNSNKMEVVASGSSENVAIVEDPSVRPKPKKKVYVRKTTPKATVKVPTKKVQPAKAATSSRKQKTSRNSKTEKGKGKTPVKQTVEEE